MTRLDELESGPWPMFIEDLQKQSKKRVDEQRNEIVNFLKSLDKFQEESLESAKNIKVK